MDGYIMGSRLIGYLLAVLVILLTANALAQSWGIFQDSDNLAGPGGFLCDNGTGACNGATAGYLTNGAAGKLYAR